MKYYVWDDDHAVMVCATDSRKHTFEAVLAHMIRYDGTDDFWPILFPVAAPPAEAGGPKPVLYHGVNDDWDDCWSLIRQAQEAYIRLIGFIPAA